jgi:hypothetical protein
MAWRFECCRDAAPWTATISFSKCSPDREELRLPDVTLKIELAQALTGNLDREREPTLVPIFSAIHWLASARPCSSRPGRDARPIRGV